MPGNYGYQELAYDRYHGTLYIHTNIKPPYKAIAVFVGLLILYFVLFISLSMLHHNVYTYEQAYDEDNPNKNITGIACERS